MALEVLDIRPSEKGSEIVTSAGSFWRVDWWPDKDIRAALYDAHQKALPGYRLQDQARALRIAAVKARKPIPTAQIESLLAQMHPIHEEAKALGTAAHAEMLKRHGEECAGWAEPLVAARAAADLASKAEAEAEAAVAEKREAIIAYVESHAKDADVASLLTKAVPVAAEPVEKEIG